MADYEKAGLLVVRENRILLCRKKHTTALLILPGGCFEPGETWKDCLLREVREELGPVEATGLSYVGMYTDRAAGTADKTVCVTLYQAELTGEPEPHSEIRELVWFGEHDPRQWLSPSIRNKILPDLIERGILRWAG